jgi:hypothetical protein
MRWAVRISVLGGSWEESEEVGRRTIGFPPVMAADCEWCLAEETLGQSTQ